MNSNHKRLNDYSSHDQSDREKEENYLNLWSYVRRRHPGINLSNISFYELIDLKNSLENFHDLRQSECEIATVRKH
ncbi:hypothetical protein WDW89_03570 [Deltaproteobacteria bacterium TL4]